MTPMRKSVLSLAVVALIGLPLLAGEFNKKISVGDKAPDFAGIPAVMKDQDTSLTLSDLKDDIVVLVFLANHCPVVGHYEDRVIDFAKEYQGKGVRVVGVAVTGGGQRKVDDLPAIKKRVLDKGYGFAYGFDETQKIGKDYGVVATPQFFVLDKARVIRYTGSMDDNENPTKVTKTFLKDAVDALLAGKEVPVKETKAFGCGVVYDKR
jgi:thiol-disulfide isomerase/thioredoxin